MHMCTCVMGIAAAFILCTGIFSGTGKAGDDRFRLDHCIPAFENIDKGLHSWCQDLRSDPEMRHQEDYDYDRYNWIKDLEKEEQRLK